MKLSVYVRLGGCVSQIEGPASTFPSDPRKSISCSPFLVTEVSKSEKKSEDPNSGIPIPHRPALIASSAQLSSLQAGSGHHCSLHEKRDSTPNQKPTIHL